METKKHKMWVCPECKVRCAEEVEYKGRTMIQCQWSQSNGDCWFDTVSKTRKRVNDFFIEKSREFQIGRRLKCLDQV